MSREGANIPGKIMRVVAFAVKHLKVAIASGVGVVRTRNTKITDCIDACGTVYLQTIQFAQFAAVACAFCGTFVMV